MERNASIYGIVLVSFLHVPVHIRINQAEMMVYRHQSLVMAFRIGDGLFIFAAVGHFPDMLDGFQSSSIFSLIVLIQ